MEVDGHDMRPEPIEERRKRLSRLVSRKNKAMRDGIQLSEAIARDGAAIFRLARCPSLRKSSSAGILPQGDGTVGLLRRNRLGSLCPSIRAA
jgi:hypothetical protein